MQEWLRHLLKSESLFMSHPTARAELVSNTLRHFLLLLAFAIALPTISPVITTAPMMNNTIFNVLLPIATPVPFAAIARCWFASPRSLESIVNCALIAPLLVGEKSTFTVWLAPGASVNGNAGAGLSLKSLLPLVRAKPVIVRSEERRVGKECRSR